MSVDSAAVPTVHPGSQTDEVPAEAIAPVSEFGIGKNEDLTSPAVNTVVLLGVVSVAGEIRAIAGGIEIVRWTLRVPRDRERGGADLIDCIALAPVLQQRALAWPLGTALTVEGSLRRRFFRTGGRTATRVEVEAEQVSLHPIA